MSRSRFRIVRSDYSTVADRVSLCSGKITSCYLFSNSAK